MSHEITPFLVQIPQEQLDDLHDRLRRTRWPEQEPVDDWSQGIPLAYMRDLCAYWLDGYDWRATEARLNGLPQFQTVIDGVSIHFIHVRSPRPGALPLIISHGWPGSVIEYLKVLAISRLLTRISAAMIWRAPDSMAPWTAFSPTPPQPITSTDEPASILA